MSQTSTLSARVPRTARTILDRMIATRQISPEGVNWLIAATDPFHDTELSISGYPDIASSKSVVQKVTQTVNVASNQGSPPAGNWDCHIFFNPCSMPWSYDEDTTAPDPYFYKAFIDQNSYCNQGTPNGPRLVAGFNAVGTPPGADWTLSSLATEISQGGIGIDSAYSYGTYRLIAAGYEVVNTTAEINKQGSVTAYKSPCQLSNGSVTGENPTGSLITMFASLGPYPPTTQATAALFPNSKTWMAADGIYQICTLNTLTNPYSQPQPGSCAGLISNQTLANLEDGSSYQAWMPNINQAALNGDDVAPTPQNFRFPFDISGCVFAGLSPLTTLQITTKYYFERVPTFTDPALLVLSTPSPAFDPVALEIYSRVLDELPVAVPVGENPLGEWFSDVLRAVAEWAPKVGSALGTFVPGAGLLGQGIGVGAKMLNKAIYPDYRPPVPAKPKRLKALPITPAEKARRAAQSAKDR
jgi:hypothetical protein